MAERTEDIEQQIKERAYFIWEYRRDNGMFLTMDRLGNLREINQLDDYFEALDEITGNLNLRR